MDKVMIKSLQSWALWGFSYRRVAKWRQKNYNIYDRITYKSFIYC